MTDIRPKGYDDATIAMNIRIMRNVRNMTAEELATLCGIGYKNQLKLESGNIPFDISLLCKIAEILDTTPGRLLDGRVTHRMLDLANIPDEAATALELLRDSLVAKEPT